MKRLMILVLLVTTPNAYGMIVKTAKIGKQKLLLSMPKDWEFYNDRGKKVLVDLTLMSPDQGKSVRTVIFISKPNEIVKPKTQLKLKNLNTFFDQVIQKKGLPLEAKIPAKNLKWNYVKNVRTTGIQYKEQGFHLIHSVYYYYCGKQLTRAFVTTTKELQKKHQKNINHILRNQRCIKKS